MKTNGKPQDRRAPRRKTPKQSEESHAQAVHPVFHGLKETVHRTENGRHQIGCLQVDRVLREDKGVV